MIIIKKGEVEWEREREKKGTNKNTKKKERKRKKLCKKKRKRENNYVYILLNWIFHENRLTITCIYLTRRLRTHDRYRRMQLRVVI